MTQQVEKILVKQNRHYIKNVTALAVFSVVFFVFAISFSFLFFVKAKTFEAKLLMTEKKLLIYENFLGNIDGSIELAAWRMKPIPVKDRKELK